MIEALKFAVQALKDDFARYGWHPKQIESIRAWKEAEEGLRYGFVFALEGGEFAIMDCWTGAARGQDSAWRADWRLSHNCCITPDEVSLVATLAHGKDGLFPNLPSSLELWDNGKELDALLVETYLK